MITTFMGPNFFRTLALATIAVTPAFTTGCNQEKPKAAVAAVTPAPSDPMEITATPAILERICVGEPTWAQIGADVTMAARVEVDEIRVTRVGSPVMGRIAELKVREGQEVQRGQLGIVKQ